MGDASGASVADSIRELGQTDLFLVADTLVSEWLRRAWASDPADPGNVPHLLALRRSLQDQPAPTDPDSIAALAEGVRAALVALAAFAPPGSRLAGDIEFAILGRDVAAGQQSSARFVVGLGFAIALVLSVAKAEGSVDFGGVHLKFQPGIPKGIDSVIKPFEDLTKSAVDAAKSQIDAGSRSDGGKPAPDPPKD